MDPNLHAHIAALYIRQRIADAESARLARTVQARPRRFGRKRKPEVATDLKLPVTPKWPTMTHS